VAFREQVEKCNKYLQTNQIREGLEA